MDQTQVDLSLLVVTLSDVLAREIETVLVSSASRLGEQPCGLANGQDVIVFV